MKRFLGSILLIAVFACTALAGGKGGYVHGYYKSNGTYVNGYYKSGSSAYALPSVPKTQVYSVPKSSFDHRSPQSGKKQQTYKFGGTTYIYGETYQNGKPKVERSMSARDQFLREHRFSSVPEGYEVDHITPLHWGGTDTPSNMQLLTKESHAQKSAQERRIDANTARIR